jgi:di/tricarboxylate transporter
MPIEAILTLCVIVLAVVLFATEFISVDWVALLIMISLILLGIISVEEGVQGFSNKATITVAFMFVLSGALLKSGVLQLVAQRLGGVFRRHFALGLGFMMLLVAFASAFINNTPVVAVFIPVLVQVAKNSGFSPSRLLIPLSFASIFGGMCTLIGTSTNILVSGIAESAGQTSFSMFTMAPLGLILLSVGVLYILLPGSRLLPERRTPEDLSEKFGMRNYLTEIELLPKAPSVGKRIMDSPLIQALEIDIIEVRRGEEKFPLPPGDFVLQANDRLQVRASIEKIKALKEKAQIRIVTPGETEEQEDDEKGFTWVEMVITPRSKLDGKKLKMLDFRRQFRAVPLAILQRTGVLHDNLYEARLQAGDVILAEVKTHYVRELKKREAGLDAPFILLSEEAQVDFQKNQFLIVLSVMVAMVTLATMGLVDIMVGAMASTALLVLLGVLNMKEVYENINWKVIFLLAGTLSLGVAMHNSGLDSLIADLFVNHLGAWGPVVVISGLYLATSLLTEMMSNNASAVLMSPIALTTAQHLELDPLPFLVAVAFAASASFMTPVGYQTNAMVYSAGGYRFTDFFRVGAPLSLLFWLLATLLIPLIYGVS